jgi:hypothetical protein
MAKRESLPVSANLLKKYVVSDSDLRWVEKQVQTAIRASKINWTNIESKSSSVYSKLDEQLDSRFDKRFPNFQEEVAEHTVKGRNLDSLMGGFGVIYGISLFVSFISIFFGLFSLFVFVLFVGGVGFLIINRASDAYDIGDGVPKELVAKKEIWLDAMRVAISREIDLQTQAIFFSSSSNDPAVLRSSVSGAWSPLGPRPSAPERALTPREAEIFVAKYMQFYGATGVAETRFSRDGGVDVEADFFVAQVKHQEAKVGVKALRELFAVASVANKQALFFAKVGFSKDAVEFANSVGISLFTYLPHLKASNFYGERYLKVGLGKTLS